MKQHTSLSIIGYSSICSVKSSVDKPPGLSIIFLDFGASHLILVWLSGNGRKIMGIKNKKKASNLGLIGPDSNGPLAHYHNMTHSPFYRLLTAQDLKRQEVSVVSWSESFVAQGKLIITGIVIAN
ncbi:conserved hypothetical protein [Ricinus communis]|uniref:Uncharacterized protein n=1 Tax=Ricinus communis TaxID=3988 RepID=B9R7T2_RICCO|nr:conserved hypothetical protein [Ricinus communis]